MRAGLGLARGAHASAAAKTARASAACARRSLARLSSRAAYLQPQRTGVALDRLQLPLAAGDKDVIHFATPQTQQLCGFAPGERHVAGGSIAAAAARRPYRKRVCTTGQTHRGHSGLKRPPAAVPGVLRVRWPQVQCMDD